MLITSFLYHLFFPRTQNTTFYNVNITFPKFKFVCNFLGSPFVQMLVHKYWAVPEVTYKKHYIWFSDGVPCRLDVCKCVSKSNTKGTIVVFHGLGGNSESAYCKRTVDEFLKDYNIIIFNRRAHVPESFSSHPPTHYDKADIEVVTRYIKNTYGSLPIYAFGVSGGANHLLNYVADSGTSCIFKKVMVCGNGWDYDIATQATRLGSTLCKFSESAYKNIVYGERFFGFKNFRKQEEAVCECENESLTDYYKRISVIHKIKNIVVPTLCLDSLDDPFYVHPPERVVNENPNISFIYTSHGSHIAWVESLFPFRVYYTKVFRMWMCC